MNRASLLFFGTEQFTDELKALPAHLRDRGNVIIVTAANEAAAQIRAGYPPGVAGSLRKGVYVKVKETPFGSIATVGNKAALAFIYENGTEARHYFTKATGAKHETGRMPPGHVFNPIVNRRRRQMQQELIALVQDEGLEVQGAA